jgi:hypothetical protein
MPIFYMFWKTSIFKLSKILHQNRCFNRCKISSLIKLFSIPWISTKRKSSLIVNLWQNPTLWIPLILKCFVNSCFNQHHYKQMKPLSFQLPFEVILIAMDYIMHIKLQKISTRPSFLYKQFFYVFIISSKIQNFTLRWNSFPEVS